MSGKDSSVPADDLEPGRAYRLKSRNLFVGFWEPERGGFIGVREKFGDRFLFTEYLYKELSGTALPIEALDLWAGEVPLTEYLGIFCQTCDEPVEQVWNENGDRRICVGNRHVVYSDCPAEGTYCAYIKMNEALFDLLDDWDLRFAEESRTELAELWDTVHRSKESE